MTTSATQPANYGTRVPFVSADDWNAYIVDLVDANFTFTSTNLTVKTPATFNDLLTANGNIIVPDGGTVGSTTKTDAITISSSGTVTCVGAIVGTSGNFGTGEVRCGMVNNQVSSLLLQNRGTTKAVVGSVGLGVGTETPGYQLHVNGSSPSLALDNLTEEDIEGGRESEIRFKGETAASFDHTLALIVASHDGTGNNQKGDLIFYTNDGNDVNTPTERLRIDSTGLITARGNIVIPDAGTIGSTSATTAITIAADGTVTFSALTVTGLLTANGNIVIPDAGTIGSTSDTDAVAIASTGVVTLSQSPVIGTGAIGVDYTLTFNGENSDGVLTWNEGISGFVFDNNVYLGNGGLISDGGLLNISGYQTSSNDDNGLVMHNTNQTDDDGGRVSKFIAKGEQSGGEISTLGYMAFSHEGDGVDDEAGQFVLGINSGTDGSSPPIALTIDKDGTLTIGDIHCGNIDSETIAIGKNTFVDTEEPSPFLLEINNGSGGGLVSLENESTTIVNGTVLGGLYGRGKDQTAGVLLATGAYINFSGRDVWDTGVNVNKAASKIGFHVQDETTSDTLGTSLLTMEVWNGVRRVFIPNGDSIGSESAPTAITISSAGIVTFIDDIIIKDGGTIGPSSATTATTWASNGDVYFAENIGMATGKQLIANNATNDYLTFDVSGYIQLLNASAGVILATEGCEGNTILLANSTDNQSVNIQGTGGLSVYGDSFLLNALTVTGLLTANGNIVIPNAGTIGSASKTDAIAIASDGDLTLSGNTIIRDIQTSNLALSGGTASNNGANVLLYGSNHASLADVTRFRVGSTASMTIDGSGDVLMNNALTVTDLLTAKDNIVLPKTTNVGIKVDTDSPTFGYRDILGATTTKNVGATKPSFEAYNGAIDQFRFSAGDEESYDFHIPHDYVPGTDLYLHVHWSQISTTNTGGTLTFRYSAVYASGYGVGAFTSTPVTATFTSADAGSTRYDHFITEIIISGASATATLFDRDSFEIDGLILVTLEMDANNLTDSSAVTDPFIHYVDIHYQSTNMATKDKNTPFYT